MVDGTLSQSLDGHNQIIIIIKLKSYSRLNCQYVVYHVFTSKLNGREEACRTLRRPAGRAGIRLRKWGRELQQLLCKIGTTSLKRLSQLFEISKGTQFCIIYIYFVNFTTFLPFGYLFIFLDINWQRLETIAVEAKSRGPMGAISREVTLKNLMQGRYCRQQIWFASK